MIEEKQYTIETPNDFRVIIDDLLGLGGTNLVIALEGDLGAGKTTFTQELAKFLGVTEGVTSPTFTIMRQYEILSEKFDLLVHIDAYRIESEDEVSPLHLEEIFNRPNTVVCVEWPQNIQTAIPNNSVKLSISIDEGDVRQVSLLKF